MSKSQFAEDAEEIAKNLKREITRFHERYPDLEINSIDIYKVETRTLSDDERYVQGVSVKVKVSLR